MRPFSRSDRVGSEIQKVLSDLLRKGIKDPRLEMATITGVKMTRDLKIARIYFALAGSSRSKAEAAEGFSRASGFIKRRLARELGLRYTPELEFFYDESFDYGSHIDKILKAIKSEDGSNHTPVEKQ